jgi:hypothetical protein
MGLCDTGTTPNATDLAMMYATAVTAYQYTPMFNYPFDSVYQVRAVFPILLPCLLIKRSSSGVPVPKHDRTDAERNFSRPSRQDSSSDDKLGVSCEMSRLDQPKHHSQAEH